MAIRLLKYIFVFIIFLSLFLFIQFSSPNFISSDDGFYHIKHSRLYLENGLKEAVAFPYAQFSILKDKPSDMWFLYHLSLVPFTNLFEVRPQTGSYGLIVGSKVAHSIFVAFIFVVFYFILSNFFVGPSPELAGRRRTPDTQNNYFPSLNGLNASKRAFNGLFHLIHYYKAKTVRERGWRRVDSFSDFFWTFFLFAASFDFIFRLLLPRPHILSILFVLLAFYFIIRQKLYPLFFIAALHLLSHPLFYIILILAILYVVVQYFYNKDYHNLSWRLPLFVLAGFGVGFLIHPNAANFFEVGFLGSLNVIFQRFFGTEIVPIGGEMYAGIPGITENLLWLIPFYLVLIYFYFVIFRRATFVGRRTPARQFRGRSDKPKNWRDKISLEKFYLFVLTVCFFVLSIFIRRAVEYFIPFVVLLIALIWKEDLVPAFRGILQKIRTVAPAPSPFKGKILTSVYNSFVKSAKYLAFGWQRKTFRFFFYFVFFWLFSYYFIFNITSSIQLMKGSDPYNKYQKAAEFMAVNSEKGDIVFNADWGDFPRLFFFNSKNYYIAETEPTRVYLKNKEKYWLWKNIGEDGIACSKQECSGGEIQDVYETIKNDFGAKFVFINNIALDNAEERRYQKLLSVLEKDERFTLSFKDKDYPEILVYRLKE